MGTSCHTGPATNAFLDPEAYDALPIRRSHCDLRKRSSTTIALKRCLWLVMSLNMLSKTPAASTTRAADCQGWMQEGIHVHTCGAPVGPDSRLFESSKLTSTHLQPRPNSSSPPRQAPPRQQPQSGQAVITSTGLFSSQAAHRHTRGYHLPAPAAPPPQPAGHHISKRRRAHGV